MVLLGNFLFLVLLSLANRFFRNFIQEENEFS